MVSYALARGHRLRRSAADPRSRSRPGWLSLLGVVEADPGAQVSCSSSSPSFSAPTGAAGRTLVFEVAAYVILAWPRSWRTTLTDTVAPAGSSGGWGPPARIPRRSERRQRRAPAR